MKLNNYEFMYIVYIIDKITCNLYQFASIIMTTKTEQLLIDSAGKDIGELIFSFFYNKKWIANDHDKMYMYGFIELIENRTEKPIISSNINIKTIDSHLKYAIAQSWPLMIKQIVEKKCVNAYGDFIDYNYILAKLCNICYGPWIISTSVLPIVQFSQSNTRISSPINGKIIYPCCRRHINMIQLIIIFGADYCECCSYRRHS